MNAVVANPKPLLSACLSLVSPLTPSLNTPLAPFKIYEMELLYMFKSLGKYSVIIVTTVLFLALVLTVLGLNFYMSFQVEANAEAVNVAGRQRMLSQRISKSLLNTQAAP